MKDYILPDSIITTIDKLEYNNKLLTTTNKRDCYDICSRIYTNLSYNDPRIEYSDIPRSYFTKLYGNASYSILLTLLKDNNIIEAKLDSNGKEYFLNLEDKKQCKSYRICNKHYKTPNLRIIQVKDKSSREIMLNNLKSITLKNSNFKQAIEILNEVNITYDLQYASSFETNRLINNVDYSNTTEAIKVSYLINGKPVVKSIIPNNNFTKEDNIIFYNKRYYIGNKVHLTTQIRRRQLTENIRNIQLLMDGVFRASRNETNERLDTNITNIKSEYFNLELDGEKMIYLDMKNCQPCLLANFIHNNTRIEGFRMDYEETNEDAVLFYDLATTGTLYEYIQEHTDLSRSEAKMMFIIVLYGNTKTDKPAVMFRKLFPTIWRFIIAYRNRYGYEKLSVFFQSLESKLFIDGIYTDCLNNGIKCLTKHDSICFKESDYFDILKTIEEHLEKNNIKAKVDEITNKNELKKLQTISTIKNTVKQLQDNNEKISITNIHNITKISRMTLKKYTMFM